MDEDPELVAITEEAREQRRRYRDAYGCTACVHRVEADWPIDSLRKLCGINDMEIS